MLGSRNLIRQMLGIGIISSKQSGRMTDRRCRHGRNFWQSAWAWCYQNPCYCKCRESCECRQVAARIACLRRSSRTCSGDATVALLASTTPMQPTAQKIRQRCNAIVRMEAAIAATYYRDEASVRGDPQYHLFKHPREGAVSVRDHLCLGLSTPSDLFGRGMQITTSPNF